MNENYMLYQVAYRGTFIPKLMINNQNCCFTVFSYTNPVIRVEPIIQGHSAKAGT